MPGWAAHIAIAAGAVIITVSTIGLASYIVYQIMRNE